MENARSHAFNWAFVAMFIMVCFYSTSFLFGGMPPLTIGGYAVETSIIDGDGKALLLTVPMITSHALVVIVPLCVFAIRYIWDTLFNVDVTLVYFCGIFSGAAAFGTGLGHDPFLRLMLAPILLTAIVILVYVLGFLFYLIKQKSEEETNVTLGATVSLVVFHSLNLFMHAIIHTPYRLEWLLFLPGIVILLFLASIMLVSIIPCIIACYERLCVLVGMLKDGRYDTDELMGS